MKIGVAGFGVGGALLALAAALPLGAQEAGAGREQEPAGLPAGGIPVTSDAVVRGCAACHTRDESGRMSRISYLRKTPEGWESSVRRMVSRHGVPLDPEVAREIVRYLADHHGLAPEELRPALYEVERQPHVTDFEVGEKAAAVCMNCHSIGTPATQRRTAEEWRLLADTHATYFPLTFRRGRGGNGPDAVEQATTELAETYPLASREWAEWSANLRPPRIEGSWAIAGYETAAGPVFGRMELTPVDGAPHEFTTTTTYVHPQEGVRTERTGRVTIYTGYQWRGRSAKEGSDEEPLREVMFVEPDLSEIHGRWFNGAYEEVGIDLRMVPIGADAVVSGAWPQSLPAGADHQVRIYGANLPADLLPGDVDLGPGVRVLDVVAAGGDSATLRVAVAADARVGPRDVALGRVVGREAFVVYDRVDFIKVEPDRGMARVGGASLPKQYERFEAVAYDHGQDGEAGTEDDLRIGAVPASWSVLEYPRTFNDDDVQFVGSISQGGVFTPAPDGPNPERSGNRNNIGDVWVQATYVSPDAAADAEPLRARAFLVVSPPRYVDWDPATLSVPVIGGRRVFE